MILYVTLGVSDIPRAVRFCDAILAPLGQACTESSDTWAAYGSDYGAGCSLWLCTPFDGAPASVGNGTMVAFTAATAGQVHAAFHAAALTHGGTDEGPPCPRPHYGAQFYAAYVRDPDGNRLTCVCHTWQG
jgi:catechol 2,3-dioxygenase-like lactoylglutathione lyase family enzyme